MNTSPVGAPMPALDVALEDADRPATSSTSFGSVLATMVDGAKQALDGADAMAAAVAHGGGDVVAASVARAKADVMLQVVAVTASRASGALNSLLQTQV